jgi:hypothetical protein
LREERELHSELRDLLLPEHFFAPVEDQRADAVRRPHERGDALEDADAHGRVVDLQRADHFGQQVQRRDQRFELGGQRRRISRLLHRGDAGLDRGDLLRERRERFLVEQKRDGALRQLAEAPHDLRLERVELRAVDVAQLAQRDHVSLLRAQFRELLHVIVDRRRLGAFLVERRRRLLQACRLLLGALG